MNETPAKPFQVPVYRAFWVCAFISNLGTWIQDVASSWVMTHLSSSPLVISLLSFCTSMPVLLLSIPAGYIADKGYRQKILLVAQCGMFFAAGTMAYLVWAGTITEATLLGLSLLMGVGFALTNPTFQSVLTDLVPNAMQAQAVLVYYMGINLTRVLGPALGGGFLSAWGPASAFLINSVSFLGLILFFWRWPVPEAYAPDRNIKFQQSDWSGLFSLHNLKLWSEMFFVTFFASSLWALYPLRGRIDLDLNSWQYGSLLGSLGLGACVSAFFSEKVLQPQNSKKSLAGAYIIYATGVFLLGASPFYWGLCVAMFLGGIGWLVLATLMNMSSRQINAKSQLKATMLGVFMAVFYAGMALGAVTWGLVARESGPSVALYIAAISLGLIGFAKGIRSFGGLH